MEHWTMNIEHITLDIEHWPLTIEHWTDFDNRNNIIVNILDAGKLLKQTILKDVKFLKFIWSFLKAKKS